MEHFRQQIYIRNLLVRLVENDINDEESRVLNRWFKEDPGAVPFYCEFLRVYAATQLQISGEINCETDLGDNQFDRAVWAALKEMEDTAPVVEIEASSPACLPPVKVLRIEKKRISKKMPVAVIVSIAALLFLICILHFFPAESSHSVASVTGSYNTLWSGAGESISADSRLWNDGRWYSLKCGKAEITFDSGAIVLIEAPACLAVLGENEMDFEGVLTARVPTPAHGFTVHTPHSTIVDLGTEFGIFADAQESRVFVRQGEVEMKADFSSKPALKQRISTGKAYQVDRAGTVSEVVFQPNIFRWESPDTYEQAVYHTGPLAYWRFDRDQPDRILNEMNPQEISAAYEGRVQLDAPGPNLGSGKPNCALRLFGREKNANEAIPAGYGMLKGFPNNWNKTGGYSIILWIRPEALGLQSILVYSSEETSGLLERYSDQIYLNKDNQISFYVYCPDSAVEGQALQSINAAVPVRLQTWYHVAVTCSAENHIKLYVDGQLQATKQLPSRPESNPIGYVGCSTVNPYYDLVEHLTLSREPFCGLVDEISQYDRTLSAGEIETLYRAAGNSEEGEPKP